MKSLKIILLLSITIGVIFLLFFRKPKSSLQTTTNETSTLIEIPTVLAPEKTNPTVADTQINIPPQPSKLPLLVIGTLVHSDSNQSLTALYNIKNKQSDICVNRSFFTDSIQISKIERGIVYFQNLKTLKFEFLKLNENDLDPYRNEIAASRDVQQTAKNSFSVKRKTLDKYLNDLTKTLLTASVIPHRSSRGEVDGFQFVDLLPMGIFDQLGFQKGDTIKTVNGETVDSLQKVIEIYNSLKESKGFKIQIDRNGKSETFDYQIP